MEFLVILDGFGSEKQSQFIIVRSSAFGGQRQDEGKEFEKNKANRRALPGNSKL
jgi:hypothetical protein